MRHIAYFYSAIFTTPTLLSTTAIAEYGFGVILSPSFSPP